MREQIHTPVNDIVVVKIVDSIEYLSNGLCGIFLCKLSLLADAIE